MKLLHLVYDASPLKKSEAHFRIEYWMDQNFISYEKGGSIEDLEKKNPTLKASREHEKRDKDFEIFEVSVEADAMMFYF